MTAKVYALGILMVAFHSSGCASRYQMIGAGMVAGAAAGAGSGYLFVHHGQNKQYEVRNTIITSAVFALLAGGAMALHYRSLEKQRIDISGEYARYRLCDPEDAPSNDISRQSLGNLRGGQSASYFLTDEMIGKNSIHLDDTTKWIYPVFRKRYLPPEQNKDSVTSSRFIWEIVKPGEFITRTKNPEYFLEMEKEDEEIPTK